MTDALEVFFYKLKPETAYNVYAGGQRAPVVRLKTDGKGMANGTAIGPMRDVRPGLAQQPAGASRTW